MWQNSKKIYKQRWQAWRGWLSRKIVSSTLNITLKIITFNVILNITLKRDNFLDTKYNFS